MTAPANHGAPRTSTIRRVVEGPLLAESTNSSDGNRATLEVQFATVSGRTIFPKGDIALNDDRSVSPGVYARWPIAALSRVCSKRRPRCLTHLWQRRSVAPFPDIDSHEWFCLLLRVR
jgi:hypothetical protein